MSALARLLVHRNVDDHFLATCGRRLHSDEYDFLVGRVTSAFLPL